MRNIKYNYVCRNKGLYYRYIAAKRKSATWNGNTRGCLRIVRLDRFMVRWIIPVISLFILMNGNISIAAPKVTSHQSPSLMKETGCSAILRSVKVASELDTTLLDLNIAGPALPVLAYSGRNVIITLANTKADKQLSEHINTGGAVERISFDNLRSDTPGSEIKLALSTPSVASLVSKPDSQTFRIRISPAVDVNKALPSVNYEEANGSDLSVQPKTYSFNAYESDVVPLIKSLADQSGLNIILIGNINSKISAHFKNAQALDALTMLTKSAGLIYYVDNGVYYIGSFKDISGAFPTQQVIYKEDQQVYECKNVSAIDLANSIASVFSPSLLHVTLGAGQISPHLDGSGASSPTSISSSTGSTGSSANQSTNASTGSSTTPTTSGSGSSGTVSGSSTARTIILSGEPSTVANALVLAARLDIRRVQVKIDVRITDISVDALKDLGVQWTFSNYTIREKTATELKKTVLSGIGPGAMTHNPITFDGAISALEKNNKAKLLAAPSMSLLDGEKGSILIGQRVLYPVLVAYTQAQTPIFDKAEERVAIYLQLSVQMTGKDEIILSVYPQVSFITSYLNINGASYPQISTREQQTTIRVKNGQGIVIGGLISNQEINEIEKVPVLSSVPFFGDLFKHRKTSHTQDEVVIMLTPVIQAD